MPVLVPTQSRPAAAINEAVPRRWPSRGHSPTPTETPATTLKPTSVVDELLNAAREADGGLDEQQIAEILDTPELGVDVEVTHRRSTTPAAATDE
jgi:hypothetical protein